MDTGFCPVEALIFFSFFMCLYLSFLPSLRIFLFIITAFNLSLCSCLWIDQTLCCQRKARRSSSQTVHKVECHKADLRVRHGAVQSEQRQKRDHAGRGTGNSSHLQNLPHSLRYRQVLDILDTMIQSTFLKCGS